MSSGIYQICNRINGKIYIGSAVNIKKRWHLHLHRLRNNIHHNSHLQNAWNKYGEENFEFEVIEYWEPEFLVSFEQWWINMLKPEYNIRKIARSNFGIKYTYTDEAKRNMKNNINNSKLKPEYIPLLRELYKRGIKQVRLAEICGVKPSTISNVIIGRRWSWI